MFEHHASHVIVDLSHRCRRAAVERRDDDAKRLANLAGEIEREFPEAAAELNSLYSPQSSQPRPTEENP